MAEEDPRLEGDPRHAQFAIAGDPERPPPTAEQLERVERERRLLQKRARDRVIGYFTLAGVVLVLLLPAMAIVGLESGIFVWFFNLARHL